MQLSKLPPSCFLIGETRGETYRIASPQYSGFTDDTDNDGHNDTGKDGLYNGVDFRHEGRSNFLFAGGHVAPVIVTEFVTNSNGMLTRK